MAEPLTIDYGLGDTRDVSVGSSESDVLNGNGRLSPSASSTAIESSRIGDVSGTSVGSGSRSGSRDRVHRLYRWTSPVGQDDETRVNRSASSSTRLQLRSLAGNILETLVAFLPQGSLKAMAETHSLFHTLVIPTLYCQPEFKNPDSLNRFLRTISRNRLLADKVHTIDLTIRLDVDHMSRKHVFSETEISWKRPIHAEAGNKLLAAPDVLERIFNNCTKLHDITIYGHNLTPELLEVCAPNWSALNRLRIIAPSPNFGDQAILHVTHHSKKLRKLEIEGPFNAPARMMRILASRFRELDTLTLSTAMAARDVASSVTYFSKNLTNLSLISVPELTDFSLEQIMDGNWKLERIRVIGCPRISVRSVTLILARRELVECDIRLAGRIAPPEKPIAGAAAATNDVIEIGSRQLTHLTLANIPRVIPPVRVLDRLSLRACNNKDVFPLLTCGAARIELVDFKIDPVRLFSIVAERFMPINVNLQHLVLGTVDGEITPKMLVEFISKTPSLARLLIKSDIELNEISEYTSAILDEEWLEFNRRSLRRLQDLKNMKSYFVKPADISVLASKLHVPPKVLFEALRDTCEVVTGSFEAKVIQEDAKKPQPGDEVIDLRTPKDRFLERKMKPESPKPDKTSHAAPLPGARGDIAVTTPGFISTPALIPTPALVPTPVQPAQPQSPAPQRTETTTSLLDEVEDEKFSQESSRPIPFLQGYPAISSVVQSVGFHPRAPLSTPHLAPTEKSPSVSYKPQPAKVQPVVVPTEAPSEIDLLGSSNEDEASAAKVSSTSPKLDNMISALDVEVDSDAKKTSPLISEDWKVDGQVAKQLESSQKITQNQTDEAHRDTIVLPPSSQMKPKMLFDSDAEEDGFDYQEDIPTGTNYGVDLEDRNSGSVHQDDYDDYWEAPRSDEENFSGDESRGRQPGRGPPASSLFSWDEYDRVYGPTTQVDGEEEVNEDGQRAEEEAYHNHSGTGGSHAGKSSGLASSGQSELRPNPELDVDDVDEDEEEERRRREEEERFNEEQERRYVERRKQERLVADARERIYDDYDNYAVPDVAPGEFDETGRPTLEAVSMAIEDQFEAKESWDIEPRDARSIWQENYTELEKQRYSYEREIPMPPKKKLSKAQKLRMVGRPIDTYVPEPRKLDIKSRPLLVSGHSFTSKLSTIAPQSRQQLDEQMMDDEDDRDMNGDDFVYSSSTNAQAQTSSYMTLDTANIEPEFVDSRGVGYDDYE
ncbi:hypothetical protein V1517DRAFT_321016 [Lipomyces orientalis]|uniref:Uncharacterized protein n=1 Tax=Lipomyces orientalis TaxID=1233043 RepID=A0ACC3TQN2_9ASCO